jgi:tousled-like kinase
LYLYHRRQEEITSEREEIDRQKKMLVKKRPSNSETGGRKRASSQSSGSGSSSSSTNSVPINSTPSVSTPPIVLPNPNINNNQVTGATTGTVLHNGTVAPSSALDTATFLKPEAVPGLSWQEYYEADEILKVNNFISVKNFKLFVLNYELIN